MLRIILPSWHFNPLHHEGGDPLPYTVVTECHRFQSTPPRGWRRPFGRFIISIHSTTRVETKVYGKDALWVRISIHSTTRVETLTTWWCFPLQGFQSTPPRGWRHGDTKDEKWKQEISIHSTTRVETVVMIKLPLSYIISIHSTTRVETSVDIPTDILYLNFNPLHHEGGDPVIAGIKDEDTRFQSTPPRGWRRHQGCVIHAVSWISIHSTTRVETNYQLLTSLYREFQSTPPRGWRPLGILGQIPAPDFNPLHHEGGDSNTTQ